MKFQTDVVQMFYWRWTASIYAWLARRKGYTTKITRESNWDRSNEWELGGNYGVVLTRD